ncbi:MAG: hypothetical protein ACT4OY_09065 [Alphaproteobacteria bacterium]
MAIPGAETIKNLVPGAGFLKKIFTLGAIGTIATAGGMLLLPITGAVAGGAFATAGATNASVLGSFWATLFTSTTGEIGLTAGLTKIFSGFGALFNSGAAVLTAGFNAVSTGSAPFSAMNTALFAPVAG